ncbi:MAG: DUF5011 domain-containing protein [Tenericutes bacterium]|nr:DUF5011 domain-containing protein [Mycoplasmatota bacterium]
MNYKMKIGVLFLSLFLLVGCDKTTTTTETASSALTTESSTSTLTGETTSSTLTTETTTDLQTWEDLFPSISIVGDDLITIEQYTVFTDPGVDIIGDFDIDVTVDTDLDVTVLGDYTVTYSIIYNGITYSGTRTVRVVAPPTPIDLEWDLVTQNFTTDSISVLVSYADPDGVLTNGTGSLYLGDTLVNSYDLISGDNYLNFNQLQSNMEYTFVVEGSYVDNGTTVILEGYELTITTAELITMQFSLSNEETTHNSYTSDITIDYASSNILTKTAYLYLGEAIVDQLTLSATTSTFYVNGLLSDTEYVLKVVYTATAYDGGDDETVTEVLSTFSTDVLPAPEFVLLLCTPGVYDLECAVGVLETGLTDVSLRIEVWVAGSYHSLFFVTNSNTYVDITGLDSGTEYVLKLYADYKVAGSDELIAYTLLHEETFSTVELLTYTAPTVDNLVITKVVGTTNSVTFDFDLNDPDEVINGNIWLRMYNGTSQTSKAITVGHNTITIEGYPVYANTSYTLAVTTDYQQDAETFVWGATIHEEDFLMQPDIEVSSYSFEKSMYFHSDHIILILELDNDDDMFVEYVTINGTKIFNEDFLFPSNTHTIYLNMGAETSYTDYYYHMTNYAVTMVDDSSYVLDYDETITFRLQQPGDIDPDDAIVTVLEITTADYTRSVSSSVTDYANITIHLDNEYNLDIYSITVKGQVYLAASFEEGSTSKQIILRVEIDRNYNNFAISNLVFVRNDVNVIADAANINVESIAIYGYYSEDVIIISTAAELNSIDPSAENKYYYLAQDIDLTGFPMQPIGTATSPFQGVFDGNGHTISNLSYTSLEASQGDDVYLGLFGRSVGFIYNLTIFNADITVVTNETHRLYVGILAGYSIGTIIDCETLGTNTITISGMTEGYIGGLAGVTSGFVRDASAKTDIYIDGLSIDKGTSGNTYVGGLFGFAGVENVETSSSNGTISIVNTVNNTNIVGGLIGMYVNSTSYYATRNYILNSYASVDIYTTNYGDGSAGGLVGTVSNEYAKNTEIRNSYASGDVYSDRGYIGGLVGKNWAYITNSFATGNIDCIGGYSDHFASYGGDTFLTNNFVYDAQTVSYEGIPGFIPDDIETRLVTASATQYNDEDFYTDILGWDDYFWDFTTLIVTADILPEHK